MGGAGPRSQRSRAGSRIAWARATRHPIPQVPPELELEFNVRSSMVCRSSASGARGRVASGPFTARRQAAPRRSRAGCRAATGFPAGPVSDHCSTCAWVTAKLAWPVVPTASTGPAQSSAGGSPPPDKGGPGADIIRLSRGGPQQSGSRPRSAAAGSGAGSRGPGGIRHHAARHRRRRAGSGSAGGHGGTFLAGGGAGPPAGTRRQLAVPLPWIFVRSKRKSRVRIHRSL